MGIRGEGQGRKGTGRGIRRGIGGRYMGEVGRGAGG